MTHSIPKPVSEVAKTLEKAGFEAYLVGGCVRDLLLGKHPKDWDIATNATPPEIQKLFTDSVYENTFGTVLVKLAPRNDAESDAESRGKIPRESALSQRESALNVVEVTTFRVEGRYTDKRHPDEIKFAKTIEEDLSRRDFTINAMAIPLQSAKRKAQSDQEIVDPYNGREDLGKKIIRAVGKPAERFNEDALRLLRAIRFAVQLRFTIEPETKTAIQKSVGLLEYIAKERIRDELVKLIESDGAVEGIVLLQESGLLRYIMPELEEGVGVGQNKHHIYTVYEHNLKAFEYAVQKKYSFEIRLASLLHDVGKPRTKRGEGVSSTFYGHQVVGERMVLTMLDRLRFPKAVVEKVALLVREHMFVYDPDVVTLAGVRRLVRRAGPENMDDLIRLREADRIGSGVPKAQPYRLRHLAAMIEKVQKDPVGPKMLAIRGEAVMEILKIEPGPRVGKILAVLLEEVLDDPTINEGDRLATRVKELGAQGEKELDALAKSAKEKAASAQERIDEEIKKKYFVK